MTTRLLSDRSTVLAQLRALRPTKIAVAYVGSGWRNLLGPAPRLKQIVLSPTMGTNPRAVEHIAAKIGWKNVHFLDELHAKLYLGKGAAMFGSANLSNNALGHSRTELYELVTHTTDPTLVSAAEREFATYVSIAQDSYRSEADKKARIRDLKQGQPAIEAARVKLSRPLAPSLDAFDIGSRRILLEWYEHDDAGVEDDSQAGDREYMNLLLATPGQARVGDWLLEWTCHDNGHAPRHVGLGWMRIDAVRPCVLRAAYPDQVAQRHRAPSSAIPFRIDPLVRKLFRQLIMENDALRPTNWTTPLPSPTLRRVNAFLAELQRRYITAAG